MRVTEGEIQSCVAQFFNDDGPVQRAEHGTGPLIYRHRQRLNIIMDGLCQHQMLVSGVPRLQSVLGLDDDMVATIVWVFESASGVHRLSEADCEPQISHRVGDCVCMFMEPDQQGLTFDLVVPCGMFGLLTPWTSTSADNMPVAKCNVTT